MTKLCSKFKNAPNFNTVGSSEISQRSVNFYVKSIKIEGLN